MEKCIQHILPRLVTINSTLCTFHYKILNNVLYLNKQFFRFGLVTSKLCSFCNSVKETAIHIFAECSATKKAWKNLFIIFETLYIYQEYRHRMPYLVFYSLTKELLRLKIQFVCYSKCIYTNHGKLKKLMPWNKIETKRKHLKNG